MTSQDKRPDSSRAAKLLEQVLWLVAIALTLIGLEGLARMGIVRRPLSGIAFVLLLDLIGYCYVRRRHRPRDR